MDSSKKTKMLVYDKKCDCCGCSENLTSMRPTQKKFEIHFCDKAECKQFVTDTVTQIYDYAKRDIPLEFKYESCTSELIDPNEYIKRPGVIEDIAHMQECCMKMQGKIPGFQLTRKNSSLFMVVVSWLC